MAPRMSSGPFPHSQSQVSRGASHTLWRGENKTKQKKAGEARPDPDKIFHSSLCRWEGVGHDSFQDLELTLNYT